MLVFSEVYDASSGSGAECLRTLSSDYSANRPNRPEPYPYVRDNAFQALYLLFDRAAYSLRSKTIQQVIDQVFLNLDSDPRSIEVRQAMDGVAQHTQSLLKPLIKSLQRDELPKKRLLEGLVRRLYAGSRCDWHEDIDLDNACGIQGVVLIDDEDTVPLIGLLCSAEHVLEKLEWLQGQGADSAIEVVFSDTTALDDALWTQIRALVTGWADKLPRRLTFSWLASAGERHCTFQNRNGALIEQQLLRDIHPEAARRVELWRLQNFHLERLASDDRVYAFIGKAKRNPKDERLFILAEVFGPVDRLSRAKLWEFERAYFEGLRILRDVQSQRTQRTRLRWNWMHFYIHPALELSDADLQEMARELSLIFEAFPYEKSSCDSTHQRW